ncbi:MAG: heavy-metal-associated domain-containing protein [Acholeplasmataceae bacterium]|jgi:copper chaperone|nr:cation transporter [Acidaminococcaceae bacterium]NLY84591.1 heavy-metal-associated domain-containing protein [Acholeplasmataceae bacterium]
MQETIIKIEGMSCGHCKAAVEKALKDVGGVETAVVDLEKKQAVVTGSAAMEAMRAAVEDAGYEVVQ